MEDTTIIDSVFFETSLTTQRNFRPYNVDAAYGFFEIEILSREIVGLIIESDQALSDIVDYITGYTFDVCQDGTRVFMAFEPGFNSWEYIFNPLYFVNIAFFQDITSSVASVSKAEELLKIYPNPFSKQISITSHQAFKLTRNL